MMKDAEKRLHKLSQKDHDAFRRAKSIGLQLDYSALEHYIQKGFLNQEIDNHCHEITQKNLPDQKPRDTET